ncbi:Eukaryotic translation initiation factor 3 subunit B [Frankliniella fusca]|uniref:Eukaryotic translation initiation factor 3 subunit B n=1 Tax=Frankliniella fusca TaxID=407009 RepID=A0AAE1LT67_9NEOP|nr:Eukaryotic translation initiation factor 3 subunit B [Frankliniella fusca]
MSWTGQDASGHVLDGPGYVRTCPGRARKRSDASCTGQDTIGRVLDGPRSARTRSETGWNSSGRDLDGRGYVWTRWADLKRVLETMDEARTCPGHAGRTETADEFRMLVGHHWHLRHNCTTMNAGHRGRDGDRVPDGCDVVGCRRGHFDISMGVIGFL